MSPSTVTHQVVSWALARPTQIAQCDTEDAGAQHVVGVAGKPAAIQRPVEWASMQAVVRAHRTRSSQAGADPEGWVLRVHTGQCWKDGGQKKHFRSRYHLHHSRHLVAAETFSKNNPLSFVKFINSIRPIRLQDCCIDNNTLQFYRGFI